MSRKRVELLKLRSESHFWGLVCLGCFGGFSIIDGTAMEHARRFDGSYSMVFMARIMVAGAFTSAIGGLLIKDARDGSKQ